MIKFITTFLLFLLATVSFSQGSIRYEAGINISADLLQPKNFENDYDYFSSTYSGGSSFSIGMSNKLNYKKLFVRLQGSFGLSFQSQNFVFSNDVDHIIDHSVRYQIPQWILDYSFGRDFEINEINELHIELGFSTIGDFNYGNSSAKLKTEGSFSSEYIAPDDHSSGASVEEYDYSITNYWPTYLSPFIKCGISIPVSNNRLVFGVTARWNRLDYDNFIVVSSDKYSAIAESKTKSSSFGFYLNYVFSK